MDRKARSLFLPLTLGMILLTPFLGCQQTGGSSGGKGGAKVAGGSFGLSSPPKRRQLHFRPFDLVAHLTQSLM